MQDWWDAFKRVGGKILTRAVNSTTFKEKVFAVSTVAVAAIWAPIVPCLLIAVAVGLVLPVSGDRDAANSGG